MPKTKQYEWKDSNIPMFGSDTDKQVNKESAQTEQVWFGAGKKVGLQIWRIVQFKLTHWPRTEYGKFYEGDSYIVLNTYDKEELLQHDVHFWIGKYSTPDEYGTAAYKTVELDTVLDGVPVLHREVQGHESELFINHFKNVTVMRGGAESGFRHGDPRSYQPRLLHFSSKDVQDSVKEVPLTKSSLKSDSVFILDLGLLLYQYQGRRSNKFEHFKAATYCHQLESERSGHTRWEVVDEGDTSNEDVFYDSLASVERDDYVDDDSDRHLEFEKQLLRLTYIPGTIKFQKILSGDKIVRSAFRSEDVYILDAGQVGLFVWIGSETSFCERRNAITYAHNHLMKSDHPFVPVTCFGERQKCVAFDAALRRKRF